MRPLLVFGLLCACAPPVAAATTQFNLAASTAFGGDFGNSESGACRFSDNGRTIVFTSRATNLFPNDSDSFADVYRHHLDWGTTSRVSLPISSSSAARGDSFEPDISSTGQFTVWSSDAADLVPGDTNSRRDVFIRNSVNNQTDRLSVTSTGAQVDGESGGPRISPDGRWIVFWSESNLVPSDQNGFRDVYRLDRQTGTLELVSITAGGVQGNFWSFDGDVSDDGRFVAFLSEADNFGPGDTNFGADVFLKDMQTGELRRITETSNGNAGNDISEGPSVSSDGSTVSYTSLASDLVVGDTNDASDAFAYEVASGLTERLNVRPDGTQSDVGTALSTSMSFDGRYVVFSSPASDLVPGDTNGRFDIFRRDRLLQSTERVSLSPAHAGLNNGSWSPHMAANTNRVTFTSDATNVLFGDTFGVPQVYLRELSDVVGYPYCNTVPNSTGQEGEITATGSSLFVDNDVTLAATSLTPHVFGFFIVSPVRSLSVGLPEGTLCISSFYGRLDGPNQVQNTGAAGSMDLRLDLTAIPAPTGLFAAIPGTSLFFQVWHRDTVNGQPGSNRSSAVMVRVN